MAKNEPMDRGLCQGMHNLSIKQNPIPQMKKPTFQNYNDPKHETVLTNCDGPDHRPTPSEQKGHNTNHSRCYTAVGVFFAASV
jgi:hypothetical protein